MEDHQNEVVPDDELFEHSSECYKGSDLSSVSSDSDSLIATKRKRYLELV